MSNMSYCRFRNTYSDLKDCYNSIDGALDDDAAEEKARLALIKLCCQIAQSNGYEVNLNVIIEEE